MAKPARDQSAGTSQTYFVTATTWGGRSLFQSERLARIMLETLFRYREQQKYELHEFVVMPNHIHVLLTTMPGITLERAIQFIKGGSSFQIGKKYSEHLEVWERGYVDHRIRDASDYQNHAAYIRMNPVRAHLVSSPEEYAYSSAHPGFELDAPPQRLKPLAKSAIIRHG